MRKITSFEHACELLAMHPTLPEFPGMADEFKKPLLARYQLDVINKAQANGWEPDWNDRSQRKWSPFFWMNDPGFRFYDAVYGVTCTYTAGGSRPLPSERDAEYIGRTFIHLYADLFGATKIAE